MNELLSSFVLRVYETSEIYVTLLFLGAFLSVALGVFYLVQKAKKETERKKYRLVKLQALSKTFRSGH